MEIAAENPAPNAGTRCEAGSVEIEMLLDQGATLLKAGRYVRARETLEKALATVDLVMGGQAGWVVAETASRADADSAAALVETLVPLVQMSDMLLRLLARTCLASHLAEALRQRQLREDLAVWASGAEEINDLLRAERQRIERAAADHTEHAELHYHLGLVCRALGDLPAAEAAFRRVLAVCPNYTRAVVRLAVTLRQSGRAAQAPAVLAKGFAVSDATLDHYYQLGLATTDARRFDSAVEVMTQGIDPARRPDAKANLALALAQLGLLDDTRREWKESVVTPAAPAR
jgi:tetratricopeptide (TPR) repeat protein